MKRILAVSIFFILMPFVFAYEILIIPAIPPVLNETINITKGKVVIYLPSIYVNKSAVIDINKVEDVAFRSIDIAVRNKVNNINIIVTKLDAKPASVVQEVVGKVFNYIEVSVSNITDEDIESVKIEFSVQKNWISANNIDESTIVLQRYDGSNWQKLVTKKLSEDANEIHFQAESGGLSVFAITGESVLLTVPIVPKVPSGIVAKPAVDYNMMILSVLLLGLAAAFYFGSKRFVKKMKKA